MSTSISAGRRVVITGLGMISPLGSSPIQNFNACLEQQSTLKYLPNQLGDCKIGGILDNYSTKSQSSFKAFIYDLAIDLAMQTLDDSKFDYKSIQNEESSYKFGCILANQYAVQSLQNAGKLRLIKEMPHMLSAVVAVETQGAIRGQIGGTSAASAGSTLAIGEAYRLVKDGYMDQMLAGGVDLNCDQNCLPGMDAFGALTTKFNDRPKEACRPFDEERSGTVLSDGGAALMIEDLDSALRRNAKIYAEITGYAQTCDGHHVLRPTDSGVGLIKAIQQAMCHSSSMLPKEIDVFNCHATSTPKGDAAETACLKSILAIGDDLHKMTAQEISLIDKEFIKSDNNAIITANKGNFGHSVAAAGAIETVMAVQSIDQGILPAINNLENPLCDDLNFARSNIQKEIDTTVKTSLVFGGINSCLVLKKY